MTPTPPRAVLYARISDDEPDYDKPAVQLGNLRKVAKAAGYHIVDEFHDRVSAYANAKGELKDRPGYEAMVRGVGTGRYDVVLAVHPDRLSRDTSTASVFKQLCRRNGVNIHTKTMGLLNLDDPMERAMSSVMDVFSELDVAVRMAKQADRFEDEVSHGRPLWGTRPFGYNADRLTLNEEEAKEIRWAYDVVLGGGTLYSIITSWNQRGILTTSAGQVRKSKSGRKVEVTGQWSYATVQQLLRRPRNAGIVMHNDVEQVGVKARWETLVTREELEAVTAILTDSKRNTAPGRKGRKPVHLLSSVIYCAVCGAVMRSGSMVSSGKRVSIYKCSSKANGGNVGERHPTIRTTAIDALVREAVVDAFVFGPADLLGTDEGVESTAPLDAELSKLRASRSRLLQLVEIDDRIDMADVASQLAGIKSREQELESQLAERARNAAQAGMTADLRRGLFGQGQVSFKRVGMAREALGERFDALPLEQRKVLVRDLLDVRVGLGRSMSRVTVHHLVVESLNGDDIAEDTPAVYA